MLELYLKKILRIIGYNLFLFYERITNYKNERKRFGERLGYQLNLENPVTFNEKLVWKKLIIRNKLLTLSADKYEAKKYVEKVLGKKIAQEHLIPTLFITDKPSTIPFKKLPDEYILKTTHTSGYNMIIDNNTSCDHKKIISTCKNWLNISYGLKKHEWAYRNIKRKIIIEPLLRDEDNKIPMDFKFFMFHGECKIVQVDIDRYSNHARSLYDINWNMLDVRYKVRKGSLIDKPNNLDKMIYLSEKLSKAFDFVRIDLYSFKDKIYFGEFTHYPDSGMCLFTPKEFDNYLGSFWNLDTSKQ